MFLFLLLLFHITIKKNCIVFVLKMAGRFHELNDSNVEQLKSKSKAKNTTKSTNVWVRAYDDWRIKRGFVEKLENTIK